MSLLHRLRWRRPHSLRGRLLWLMSLVTLLTVTTLGAHTIRHESAQALDSVRNQAAALARSVALANVNALLVNQLDVIEEALLREADHPGVVAIHLLDARGVIVAHAMAADVGAARRVFEPPGSRLDPPASTRAVIDLLPEPEPGRIVAWHPLAAGTVLGWARVEMRLDLLDTLRHQVIWRTVIAGVLVVLGSALLLGWMLRAPLQALDEARQFAADLTMADGRQLVMTDGGTHETLQLAHALNDASTRLREQRDTIAAKVLELDREHAALQDSNLQLASIFTLSPDGLVTFDAAGRVCHANPAFGRLTGLPIDRLIGWPEAELEAQLRAQCDEPTTWQGLAPYFDEPAPDAASRPPALLGLAAPRPSKLAVVGRQALAGEDGAGTVRRLLYLRDVTHETEVDRMKSEFLSTAAHELRTPLASIHGFAELLCKRSFPEARRQQMFDTMHRNSGVMVRILNDLLDLSRIEARHGADFQRERGDLAALVAQTLADQVPPAERAAPELQPAAGPLPAIFDPGKIAQVLRNLVGNAYKYSPGGGAVQVRLLHEQPAGRQPRVGFEVCDRGIGMSAQQVARVFERFYRADPSGAILGTGLGMSIVQEIVHLHGGEVTVASTPGQGSRVSVWLPAAA